MRSGREAPALSSSSARTGKAMKRAGTILVGALGLMTLALAGCASVARDWDATRAMGTAEGYDQFAMRHRRNALADSAQIRAAGIRAEALETKWQAAKARGNVEELVGMAVGSAGAELAGRAMGELRSIVDGRATPLSVGDSRLVMDRVIVPALRKYRSYAGTMILQKSANQAITSQIVIDVSTYTEDIAHFRSITIRDAGENRQFEDVCLLGGRLYTMKSAGL